MFGLRRLLSWFSRRPEIQPPCQPVFWTLQAVYLARAYYVVAELKIADLLAEGPMTCEQLAKETGTHERSLFRILRALASFGVFAQNKRGEFEMTEAAQTLRSDVVGSVRDWTILTGTMPSWQAFGQALEVVCTGKNGFELAHPGFSNLYDYCQEHREFSETFIKAQNAWTRWQRDAILDAYDFSRFRRIVDVAGGRGSFMAGILTRCSQTTGVIFDQPETIEHTKVVISDAGLADRCELVGGSFFDEVPAGGDAYVIKHVLRDWDDQSVIKILNNCHRAMPSDAVLLVIDATMDPRNLEDRIAKLLDVEQMLWLSGKLRTTQEWDEILDQTGFRRIHEQRTAIVDAVILECQKAT